MGVIQGQAFSLGAYQVLYPSHVARSVWMPESCDNPALNPGGADLYGQYRGPGQIFSDHTANVVRLDTGDPVAKLELPFGVLLSDLVGAPAAVREQFVDMCSSADDCRAWLCITTGNCGG